MIKKSVAILCSNEGTGEHDSVEGDIVLGHELIELYLVRILPPFLPLLCVTGCDGEVATWRNKFRRCKRL